MTGSDRRRGDDPKASEPSEARGIFKRGARFLIGPSGLVARREISDGRYLIQSLIEEIKTGRASRRKIRFNEDGSFDLTAMAFDAGISVREIERRLGNRQIQTARNAMLYFGLGIGLLAIWVMAILFHGAIVATGLNMLVFLFVIMCVFVSAFAGAFNNWQVRTRRLGTIGEFIRLEASWWPRGR